MNDLEKVFKGDLWQLRLTFPWKSMMVSRPGMMLYRRNGVGTDPGLDPDVDDETKDFIEAWERELFLAHTERTGIRFCIQALKRSYPSEQRVSHRIFYRDLPCKFLEIPPTCAENIEEHFDNLFYDCWPDERPSMWKELKQAMREVELEILGKIVTPCLL